MSINWLDPKSCITTHFTVHNAVYLPSWGVSHSPSELEKESIIALAAKLEQVREYLGDHPINMNCWIRPILVNAPGSVWHGKNYNLLVGGSNGSAHIRGAAVDFTVSTLTCDEVRYHLESKLEEFNLRMEKKPGSGWIHLGNDFAPGKTRYFRS